MLKDNEIKLIIRSLDENFETKRQEYEIAKSQIQELCSHSSTKRESIFGRQCQICGKWVEVY